jgi:hypothetical protein
MISLEDCVALCGLTEEQVLAIAEHEHSPEIVATALAQYLLKREHGMEKIRDMIVDDIRRAQQLSFPKRAHLRRMLASYSSYYNESRTHFGVGEGCAVTASCPEVRSDYHHANSFRTAPSLCADMIWCWHRRNTTQLLTGRARMAGQVNKREDRHVEGSKRK